jgi:hypothetical protein
LEGAFEGVAGFVDIGVDVVVAGAVDGAVKLYKFCEWCFAKTAKVKLVIKNIVVNTAVDLVKKFAEPEAPKTVFDAPPPNDAPASAPLPCCNRIRAIMPNATKIKPAFPRSSPRLGDIKRLGDLQKRISIK